MTNDTPPLGFAVNGLVRHTSERGGEALARHAQDAHALSVLFAGDTPILRGEGDAASALHPRPALDGLAVTTQIYLGTLDDRPVLAAATAEDALDTIAARPSMMPSDLRGLATQGLVPEREIGLLAQAKSLLSWHRRHGFCAACGAPTALSASGYRRDCAACGTQHFPRTDPVVIMLIRHGDRCLLGRQARFPTGNYSCLAGFVEPGETMEDAVRRETFEEAGVRVGRVSYALSQPWPFVSSLMLGCVGEAEGDALDIDRDELEDARWFTRDEVRLMLANTHPDGLRVPPPVAIAHHLVRLFVEG
ncbi:NAD(+) diphosphatase [Salinarimonas ramus]|uniref:NAD(+) diphosphatase n=1 Tax=Salinarimonas ramus TaxID=690164 RepID=A0A917QBL9_9HYPH|nr:NAD(+) diphosphatase [Salinarimonas ramus]GGK40996.1 NADH pyrophosphatase [Salinarimonas ramus]